MRSSANGRQVWFLTVYTTEMIYPRGNFLSVRTLEEFDCAASRSRMLEYSMHSGSMGDGTLIEGRKKPASWAGVSQDSLVESLLQVACK